MTLSSLSLIELLWCCMCSVPTTQGRSCACIKSSSTLTPGNVLCRDVDVEVEVEVEVEDHKYSKTFTIQLNPPPRRPLSKATAQHLPAEEKTLPIPCSAHPLPLHLNLPGCRCRSASVLPSSQSRNASTQKHRPVSPSPVMP